MIYTRQVTDLLKKQLEAQLEKELSDYPEVDYAGSMHREDRIAFRLRYSEKEEFSEWSQWLTEEQLQSDEIREEVKRLIESNQWPSKLPCPGVLADSEYVQPSFEQLVEVIHRVSQDARFPKLTVVLASPEGDIEFLEVTDSDSFLSQLGDSIGNGFLALGLLAWQKGPQEVEARKLLFRWHTDERLKALFDKICESAVE